MAVLAFTVVGCSDSDPPAAPSPATGSAGNTASSLPTIAGVATSNANFSTLVSALSKAGLVSIFSGAGSFTVFAPTNAAFDDAARQLHFRSGVEMVAQLDVKTLTAVLAYHVYAGNLNAQAVVAADKLTMLDGNLADVSVRSGQVFIDDVAIVQADTAASNGTIHVLRSVMLPF
jgi:uncharacterized surface protein with fasciclin (FAS1) repeats